ncbi:putative phosphoglycerate mutase pmu1 [Emydomyces testavorans]|uniref:Phosphoglycerate mutase pmu1 n=1 Tax=Emydomyces testavorans TaxID=2070801 RepID=A0AAF0DL70_9EURO|nr:putative phosphoglycerate mutase pmu1 [Emydomyces testavorans]
MALTSPVLLVVTIITALLLAMVESAPLFHLEYSTVTGYFLQDDPATDPAKFDYATAGFGLINQTYDTDKTFDPHHQKSQWERFKYKVLTLNKDAKPGIKYTLLYLGRHGQGYHNVAERYYGTEAWDCYWSMLEGNGTITWADAHLTDQGIADAKVAHQTWATQMKHGIPVPESYYTSPLSRCLQTANVTFSTLNLPESNPFLPTVKEHFFHRIAPIYKSESPLKRKATEKKISHQLLRETIGIHTCDRRSSRTYINSTYPTYIIEHGFTESDTLWVPDLRESFSAQRERVRTLFDDIFTHDSNTFLSLTAHSEVITVILDVVGHRKFPLSTGAVIPVLIRAEKKPGKAPPRPVKPWTPAPKCTADPTATPEMLN